MRSPFPVRTLYIRAMLTCDFHTLTAGTQAFVCIAGEHKWEVSIARYIKMANFPHFDPAIL